MLYSSVKRMRVLFTAVAAIACATAAAQADPNGTSYGAAVGAGIGEGFSEFYGNESILFDGNRDPLSDGRSIEEHYENGHIGFWGYGPQPGTTQPGGIDVGYGPVFDNLGNVQEVGFQIVGLYWEGNTVPITPENLSFGLGFGNGQPQPEDGLTAALIAHEDIVPIMATGKEITGSGTEDDPLNILLLFSPQDWNGATSFHFDFDVTHRKPEIPTPAAAIAGLPMLVVLATRRRRRGR